MKQDNLAAQVDISTAYMEQYGNWESPCEFDSVIIHIANAPAVSVYHLLCDNMIQTRVQFEKDIAEIIHDCDDYEIRAIRDVTAAAKVFLLATRKRG